MNFTVLLSRIMDIRNFVNLTQKCKGAVDVNSLDDPKRKVNGKSILGVYSLGLDKRVQITLYTKEDMNLFKNFGTISDVKENG